MSSLSPLPIQYQKDGCHELSLQCSRKASRGCENQIFTQGVPAQGPEVKLLTALIPLDCFPSLLPGFKLLLCFPRAWLPLLQWLATFQVSSFLSSFQITQAFLITLYHKLGQEWTTCDTSTASGRDQGGDMEHNRQ